MVASSTTMSCAVEMTTSASPRGWGGAPSVAGGAAMSPAVTRSAFTVVNGTHGSTGQSCSRACIAALSSTEPIAPVDVMARLPQVARLGQEVRSSVRKGVCQAAPMRLIVAEHPATSHLGDPQSTACSPCSRRVVRIAPPSFASIGRGICRLRHSWMRRRGRGATVTCSQSWRPRLPFDHRPKRTRVT